MNLFRPCFFLVLLGAVFLVPQACGNPNTPLDANTRHIIDSLSAEEIRRARIELDSLCQVKRSAELPTLVDSIRQKRLREIQEKLKSIPR